MIIVFDCDNPQMMEIVHNMILVILINLNMTLIMMRAKIWHEKLSEIKEV